MQRLRAAGAVSYHTKVLAHLLSLLQLSAKFSDLAGVMI